MRVLVVGPKAPPLGGMALQTEALVTHLRAEQQSAEFLPCNPDLPFSSLERLPVIRALLRLWIFNRKLKAAMPSCDVVHVMANSGWSWYFFAVPPIRMAHKSGKAVVLNYRGGLAESFFSQSFKRIKNDLSLTDAVIVPTSFLQQIFSRFNVDASLVPNIVDLGMLKHDALEPKSNAVIITRNLEIIYGIDSALRAFAQVVKAVPDAQLWVCGEGPEKTRLMELANDLNIKTNVQFLGRLQRPALIAKLKQASVLLNPSRVDNSPNSLIEAMACGIPIVSTDAGGIPHLCTDQEHALLVPVDNHKAMAEAVLKIMGDKALRRTLIDSALSRSKMFAWPVVWKKLEDTYQRAIEQRKARHA